MFLILIYFICFHKSSADPLQIYLKNISENKISNDDSNEQSPNETMNIIYDAESFHFSSYYIEFFRKSKFKKVLNNDIDHYYFNYNSSRRVTFYFSDDVNKLDHLSIQKLLRRISSDFYLDLQFYIDTDKYDSRVDDMMNKTDSIYVECINKSNFGINIILNSDCFWNDKNNTEYNHFCTKTKYSRWRQVCIRGVAYCHYGTDEKIQFEYIKFSIFLMITIGAIVIVIAFVVSLYLIGYFKYKKIKKEIESKSLSSGEI